MAKVPDEFDYQRAFVIWLRGNPDRNGVPRTTPALRPGVEFWHTPNGGQRRDAFEGKRLNDLGVLAGVHDLLFLRPTRFTEGTFGLLFGMEWKRPDGRLSDAQRDVQPRLMAAGMAASCVVDNLADAREFCRKHSLTI